MTAGSSGLPAMDKDVEGLELSSGGAEKAEVLRKLNRHIMPVFIAMAICCYLDRTNLSFASLQLTADLGFTPEVYGLGSGVFFLGYSGLMIPSQLVLLYFGAPLWLSLQVTTWGIVAMAFSLMRTPSQFYVLRLLLGAAEAGAFPGMWLYLNQWFPEITFQYAMVDAAVGIANVAGAPLAAMLLTLDGAGSLRGWQWLFLLEGAPSVGVGLMMAWALPQDIASAPWLGSSEKSTLSGMLAASGKRHGHEAAVAAGPVALLSDAMSNRRLWVVSTAALIKNVCSYALLFWTPILVNALVKGEGIDLDSAAGSHKGHGHGHVAVHGDAATARVAILLTAVPFVMGAILTLVLARASQRSGERCRYAAWPYFLASVLMATFPLVVSSAGGGLGFAWLAVAIAIVVAPNPILHSLASAVSPGSAQAVALGFYNAWSNLGGVVGPVLVGHMAQRTGSYGAAMQVLGLAMLVAGIMMMAMARHWKL